MADLFHGSELQIFSYICLSLCPHISRAPYQRFEESSFSKQYLNKSNQSENAPSDYINQQLILCTKIIAVDCKNAQILNDLTGGVYTYHCASQAWAMLPSVA